MRNMPDFKNPDPSEGVANKKFSVFRNEQHVFQNIECFVQILVKKKAIFHIEIKLFDVEPDDTM